MKNLTLTICIALFILTGCKARKVLTTSVDSTAVTESHSQVRTVESKVDTSKILTRRIINSKDSSSTTIEATPTPGKQVTINTDGSITGEFTGVKSTNTKKNITNQTEDIAQQKGESSTKQIDSVGNTKQEVNLQRKVKSIDAKPKTGAWPWVIGIVIVVLVMLVLWWFLGKPKGLK